MPVLGHCFVSVSPLLVFDFLFFFFFFGVCVGWGRVVNVIIIPKTCSVLYNINLVNPKYFKILLY